MIFADAARNCVPRRFPDASGSNCDNLANWLRNMIIRPENSITTAGQLLAMPDDGNRYELNQGVLVMMSPAGSEHGSVAGNLFGELFNHVRSLNLGRTYAADTGFRISSSPDTVRAPDAAFVSHERLATIEPTDGYLPLAPDLVVEVVSPNDSSSAVESKAKQWLDAGTKIVLVADPANQSLRVYRDKSQIQVLEAGQVFESGDVCKNWRLSVNDVFQIAD